MEWIAEKKLFWCFGKREVVKYYWIWYLGSVLRRIFLGYKLGDFDVER